MTDTRQESSDDEPGEKHGEAAPHPQRSADGATALADDAVVQRSTAVLWRAFPGFLVMATLDDEALEVDGSAAEIWQAIDQPITLAELVASLADAHAVASEHVRDDIVGFLGTLIDAGLVEADG